jgi:hypothetical protein
MNTHTHTPSPHCSAAYYTAAATAYELLLMLLLQLLQRLHSLYKGLLLREYTALASTAGTATASTVQVLLLLTTALKCSHQLHTLLEGHRAAVCVLSTSVY